MPGYPVILNGDHAEVEAEHVNTPPKERPDWPLPSFDARDWAEAFCKIAKQHGHNIEEDWMVVWFANALMRGFDECTSRKPDREAVAAWMGNNGYATGHGDTIEDLLVELVGQAKRNGANEYRGDLRV